MKYLILLLAITLSACLHDEPSSGAESGIESGSETVTASEHEKTVTVKGSLKNDSLVWQNYMPDLFKSAYAATTISMRSNLAIVDPERLPAVSIASGITVEADLINTLETKIEGYRIDIVVEDETFLTKESWSCKVCYSISGGTECEGLYRIEGNNLFGTEPNPSLPVCDEATATPSLCVTQFNNDPDCASPTYKIEYQDAGDGLWAASMSNITVEALSNIINAAGLQNSGWITGTDKYARFTVYDESSVQVFQKDYVFNVIN